MQAAAGCLAQFHAKKSCAGVNVLLPVCRKKKKKKSPFVLLGKLKINVSFTGWSSAIAKFGPKSPQV